MPLETQRTRADQSQQHFNPCPQIGLLVRALLNPQYTADRPTVVCFGRKAFCVFGGKEYMALGQNEAPVFGDLDDKPQTLNL